jgi:hypothetical protein
MIAINVGSARTASTGWNFLMMFFMCVAVLFFGVKVNLKVFNHRFKRGLFRSGVSDGALVFGCPTVAIFVKMDFALHSVDFNRLKVLFRFP